MQSNPSSLLSASSAALQHMGVLARRKSPQTSNAFSARGCMDLGRVVGEAVVRLRAERDVKRRARRWVACILAAVCW